LAAGPARADTVTLSNGSVMEGLIVREDASEVELDIGYGSVILARSDIASVARSTGKAKEELKARQRDAEFASGRGVPDSGSEIFQKLQSLRLLREKAQDAKAVREKVSTKGSVLEGRIASSQAERMQDIEKLPGGPTRADLRKLERSHWSIQADKAELAELKRGLPNAQTDINAYLSALDEFKDLAARHPALGGKAALASDEVPFYDWVKRSIASMEADASDESAGTPSQGGHVVVSSLINGKARVRLIVDTGASTVMLTRKAADLAGIRPAAGGAQVSVKVADGRVVQADAVVLDSLAIGGKIAQGVEAAILPDFEEGIDGLLGMSFLKRFDVRVDSGAGKLILRDLK
jgi:clan AA aspartic protease (TIGR02281 family)